MITLLFVIQLLSSIALIAVVMLQRSKGEGLGSIGGGAQLFFDKATSIDRTLDRATVILAIVLFVATIALAIMH